MVLKNYKNIRVQKSVANFLLDLLAVRALKISNHQTLCINNSDWESTFTLTL